MSEGASMKPYYQDKWVTIYHGDCREVLPELKPVDLLFTDIPFNVNHNYLSYKDKLSKAGYDKLCRQWFSAMKPRAKAFIIKAPTKTLPIVLPAFDDVLGYIWSIIQHSPNATTHGAFNLSLFTQYLIGGELSKRPCGDFFLNTNNTIVSTHPAEMPTAPVKRLLAWFCEAGEAIIDPMCGSGTTLRAAKDINIYSIGIEIEEKYCEVAAKRCCQDVMELV